MHKSDPILSRILFFICIIEVKTLAQPQQEILSEADLDKLVDVVICETDTLWIFDLPPTMMGQDCEDAQQQLKRNAAYKALLASRLGNDRYMERGMNTLNCPFINKSVQTDKINTTETSAMATVWDMEDTITERQQDGGRSDTKMPIKQTESDKNVPMVTSNEVLEDGGPAESVPRGAVLRNFSVIADPVPGSATVMSDTTVMGNSLTPKDTMVSNSESDLFGFRYSVTSQVNVIQPTLDVLSLPKLQKDINRMERALNINTYYDKLLQYEGLHLRKVMNPAVLERSDTDASSVGPRVPPITAVQTTGTLDDNSADHGTLNAPASISQKPPQGTQAPTTASVGNNGLPNDSGVVPAGQTTGVSQSMANTPSLVVGRNSELHGRGTERTVANPDTVLFWRYQCPMTKGRNISGMAWNREDPNILAVGYGQFEFENQRKGLVCCWSLKYIEHPERFYETPSGVTAVGWSKIHSNLLAVGMFSGVIYVFDVRKNSGEPIIDTTHASGRHFGPVRKILWVVRESGRAESLSEVLVSVSTDGRVTQWFVRKGFDSTDLMVLKRSYVSAPGTGSGKSKRNESLISRTAFGCSIAFNKREPSIYVVGTEEGPIHKCSCSYNEQYLDTFLGHTASVYEIEWSPFLSEVFLSCSADWTIKLWHLDHQQPLINIQTNVNTVSSISWSPHSSIIFASANEGSLELWNLDNSTIEPYVMENVSSDANMTSVLFSECSESVLIGDSQGTVHVYGLVDFPEAPDSPEDQAARLDSILQTCIGDQS
ncbi:WD repeat-containing protein 78 [Fasciolopsis buskii]|uniref:Dynein axonemal intermediate chain 4 n=1 Tax=Fasciolopsis buskii TaxID=27845 RepID=A0A8E0RYX4_9TREM|nr:WD repeat-containing protein 78 [Fasciolopsis buski]